MKTDTVKIWEEDIVIPTYTEGKPDKNPMFFEKRVYQGSSGKVYPHTVIESISDEKQDRVYRALFLENEYLQVMMLPELGGRIQRALDKTNNYDFVYYNHVIKPALVGLCGPWISGGIEFNWPQHHRPSTYDPVDYRLETNSDGSATVWMGEVETMFRTKCLTGITLYPGRAYIEISAQLYNRTSVPQTFLWWANPAVPANEHTQSVFPPDVYAVMDHGKRDVSEFPIARGTYYKMDYSKGVDISRFKNIPVPTSYMAYHSDFDFVGGYDHEKQAGILHIADHHISPGKKQWTWGCGEFGQAWDRMLTDDDGPYIELMTGCFTNNQPDFSWLAPFEEKTFKQYFMPYKGVGMVKNATIDCAANLELNGSSATAIIYTTAQQPNALITLQAGDLTLWKQTANLYPEEPFMAEIPLDDKPNNLCLAVFNSTGEELVSCLLNEKKAIPPIPDPAKAPPLPADVASLEDLYLYGLHIEQYRHATYLAEDYYTEGLRRDPSDIRLNVAYGLLLFRRGLFAQSEKYFAAATEKLTRSNPNPVEGEAFYYYGLALRYQDKLSKAYDHFYKATWNSATAAQAFYNMACIASIQKKPVLALDHVKKALSSNARHMKARTLNALLLRELGRTEEAESIEAESLRIDPLHEYQHGYITGMNDNPCIEYAIDLIDGGFYTQAAELLKLHGGEYPLLRYYLAYVYLLMGENEKAADEQAFSSSLNRDGCFPHRLEDIIVLQSALQENPKDAAAHYYLGNLWYDKRQYEAAIKHWEASREADPSFPTVHRNLSLAYFNKKNDSAAALSAMQTAFSLDQTDARVFMELDQLLKRLGKDYHSRLERLEKHIKLVETRDDLYLEYVTALNALGHHEKALKKISARQFHPWEGGEGKISAQYLLCLTELAEANMNGDDIPCAVSLLERALLPYPENLGEGRLCGTVHNRILYLMGICMRRLGNETSAKEWFTKAAAGISEPAGMMYYNDQPPETIYYQGLALQALGRENEANEKFGKLTAYADKHENDNIRIDYFAVSLPDLNIFEDDLNRRNRVHCQFMRALGALGLGDLKTASSSFENVYKEDSNHFGVRFVGK